ncbi:class I SAM-dependent rRNA methyltransferase [Alkalihalobacillus pseudalcaliphilus]|uniref:class I SAM-dependent rRNA methyltransferase n=1 Tax=Alkalihalobacillus pseudalcaliphilus TaxID=79884 RepID=UPI00064DE7D3|nr:class I SAM-dependent rRNA methyltransferase [Alkalihalobacillus pseudalcaliphilus]KMK78055.1 50S rRNA methyltransferase [Alkalihalobacillus pseudalcaliphilus]
MHKAVRVMVKPKAEKKFKRGYPLLSKEDIEQVSVLKEEGQLIELTTKTGAYLGTGYYGKQNKGIGWILTQNRDEKINQAFFERKIGVALTARQELYASSETTAFRVFNAEGDGIGGLTIDYYDGYYVVSWYSEGVYQYHAEVYEALQNLTDYKGIYQKKRFNTGGKYVDEDDFVVGERGEFPLLVLENGVRFAVYLNDGAMVGVFLDQREVRKTIRDKYSEGKSVLNLFSYTGAFSVYAALGGAIHTTSVDLANRSLAKTIEQFSVNDVDYEAQDIIVEDVFKYFKYAKRKDKQFDVVVLDPPSFARSKKFTFSAAKDYSNLLQEAIDITAEKGTIVASTNSAAFDMNKFKSFVHQAFQAQNTKYHIEQEFSLPVDFKVSSTFKEGNYLKVLFIKKGV